MASMSFAEKPKSVKGNMVSQELDGHEDLYAHGSARHKPSLQSPEEVKVVQACLVKTRIAAVALGVQ